MKTKAAVLHEYQKPLIIEELDLDGPKEREVLVQYKVAGLCHSDWSMFTGAIPVLPLPLVAGHEGAGVVLEVGPGVTRVRPGDHVVLIWVPVCGQCYYCLKGLYSSCVNKRVALTGAMLDGTYRLKKGSQNISILFGVGSFSEYNVVNELSVLPIEHEITFDVALFGCAVMTGVGAAINTAKVKPGTSVAVVGAGGIGLNVIQGAVLASATKIIAIDMISEKLEMAKDFGATHVINASVEDPVEKVMEITGGIGVDYAFEASGHPEAALTCYKILDRGGSAVIVGMPDPTAEITLPVIDFARTEKNILGCNYGSGDIRRDMKTLIDLYRIGRLKLSELVTKRYSLEQINEGFKDMHLGKNARGVIVY